MSPIVYDNQGQQRPVVSGYRAVSRRKRAPVTTDRPHAGRQVRQGVSAESRNRKAVQDVAIMEQITSYSVSVAQTNYLGLLPSYQNEAGVWHDTIYRVSRGASPLTGCCYRQRCRQALSGSS